MNSNMSYSKKGRFEDFGYIRATKEVNGKTRAGAECIICKRFIRNYGIGGMKRHR